MPLKASAVAQMMLVGAPLAYAALRVASRYTGVRCCGVSTSATGNGGGGSCGSCACSAKPAAKDTAAYDLRTKAKVAQKAPYKVTVEKGKTYYLCSCGHSKNQPFCDGSHKEVNKAEGVEFKSILYTAEEAKDVYFCGCKQSNNMPLCDGSHGKL
eukprot:RCo043062